MDNETELRAHIAQSYVASILQWGCLLGGLIAAIWHGFESILLGGFGFWFFGMAKPPPNQNLDSATNRKQ